MADTKDDGGDLFYLIDADQAGGGGLHKEAVDLSQGEHLQASVQFEELLEERTNVVRSFQGVRKRKDL